MPKNDTVTIPDGIWRELTDHDVTAIRTQNTGSFTITLQGTAGPEPASGSAGRAGAINLVSGSILPADLSLDQLFPGVEGVVRVWAWCPGGGTASVSHA